MEKTFSDVLNEILYKLKDKYPRYDIQIVKHKPSQSRLLCNGKLLYTFNPNFLEKEVEFLKDNDQYIDFVISVFDEPLAIYHKKESKTVRRGKNSQGLSIQQIKDAMAHTKSNLAASRYLSVHYSTYRKYAKMYTAEDGETLFYKHLNPRGNGISKGFGANSGGMRLEDIIAGKYPKYASYKYKHRLVRCGYIKEECANCGFNERRISDYKIPLMLDYIDGDFTHKELSNIRLLCFNCYYLLVGNLHWRKKINPFYVKKEKPVTKENDPIEIKPEES